MKPNGKNHIEIGKSLIWDVYKDLIPYTRGSVPVHNLQDFNYLCSDSSIAYKAFYNTQNKREMLIILESWGWVENDSLRNIQVRSLLSLDTTQFNVSFQKSCFSGGTTFAESRELLNKEGEAYYSVLKFKQCDIKSLIQRKKELQFNTFAAQSFNGTFSGGNQFRRILGFDSIKDIKYFYDTLKSPFNENNHYPAVTDESVLSYLFSISQKYPKCFSYCLTINSHLPFYLSDKEKSYCVPIIRINGTILPAKNST